ALFSYSHYVAPQVEATFTRSGASYTSDDVRVYAFHRAVHRIADHPIVGTGAGTYVDFIPQIQVGIADPDNMFLLTWAELGILGVIALVGLLVSYVRVWVQAPRWPPEESTLGVACGAVACAFFVHFQFDVTWTRGTTSMAFAALGLLVAVQR